MPGYVGITKGVTTKELVEEVLKVEAKLDTSRMKMIKTFPKGAPGHAANVKKAVAYLQKVQQDWTTRAKEDPDKKAVIERDLAAMGALITKCQKDLVALDDVSDGTGKKIMAKSKVK